MLVLRKLPQEFTIKKRPQQLRNAVIAIGAGLASALAAWTVIGRRERSDVAQWYLSQAPQVTGGDNIVNVILVELRALDTFGELAVLGWRASRSRHRRDDPAGAPRSRPGP